MGRFFSVALTHTKNVRNKSGRYFKARYLVIKLNLLEVTCSTN